MAKLIPIVILVAIVWGGKSLLEHEAQTQLEVAQEMYEDGKYEKSLEKLRDLDSLFSWTPAGKAGDELREQVREKIKDRDQRREAERDWAKWEKERSEEKQRELESERQREMQKERMESWERDREREREHERWKEQERSSRIRGC